MIATLGQQYNVGEKDTVIMDTYINHHAGAPSKTKTKTKDTMSLDYSSICYIFGSMHRIECVDEENLQVMDVEIILENCPITFSTVHT